MQWLSGVHHLLMDFESGVFALRMRKGYAYNLGDAWELSVIEGEEQLLCAHFRLPDSFQYVKSIDATPRQMDIVAFLKAFPRAVVIA